MNMKKLLALVFSLTLCLSLLTACGNKDTEEPSTDGETETTTIKVAATPAPHAQMATESGDVMANYFQHIAYLDSFNADNGTHLVNVAEIHYEPYGLYPGKTATIDELSEGAKIAVPNDPSNEARALLLLEAEGLIKLKDGVGLKATKLDVENPLKLDIVEMEAAQLPGALSSVDMAVINGNYAIEAGLSVAKDAVATEKADSEAAALYANILAVKEGNENNEAVQALVKALKSDKVRDYINENYDGAVVPLF
jgi:D-methionine transport system substrate-binding protein